MKTILTDKELGLTIQRLSQQLLENHLQYDNLAIIGIQPRGIFFSDRIVEHINRQIGPVKITYGKIDNTFYRDDVRQAFHTLNQTDIPFSVENKTVNPGRRCFIYRKNYTRSNGCAPCIWK